MSIKAGLSMDNTAKEMFGYCNYGGNFAVQKAEEETSEVLVFMLVSMKGTFKWPVGYFLIKGIDARTLAELIQACLSIAHDNGINVRSITCDGASTNYCAIELLGAPLNTESYDSIKNYILHPITHAKVFVYPDPVHCIKLARNTLADYKELVSPKGK